MSSSPATTPVTDSIGKTNNEIAVGEDLKFQHSWWKFERVVWMMFFAIVILDLLGAFGRGYLARSEMRAADGTMEVKYEHIERYGTPSVMRIHFGPAAIRNGHIQLRVSQNIVNEMGNQRVIPQPDSSIVEQDGILYSFAASSGGSVAFALSPTRPGVFHVALQVPDREALQARIFVFP